MGSGAFKRNLFTYRNGLTTASKIVENVSKNNTEAGEKILEDDLAINVSLSLRTVFAENRNLE